MDSRALSALESLPAELLIKILLLLPTPGALLAATQTCKALHELFLSQAVQYSFQLQTSHQQDWTVLDSKIAPAPAAERLAILSERQQRWRTMEWKRRQAVVAKHGDGGTVYDFLGGVLALGMDSPCRTLKFYKIPSTLGSTEVPSRSCTPGWVIKDFTSDPAHDLLVLIQTWSPEPRVANVRRVSYRIHLLTLSTFEPHPEAKEATLDWPYFLSHNTSPFISVMDNVVSLQASIHRGHLPEGGLCIWDWKRGVRVATQSSKLDEVIESFSFLAKDVYVTATVNEETSDMYLNMHTFDSSYTPTESAPDFVPPPILLAIHELPEADSRPAMMSLRLDPAPGTHPGLPPFAEGEGRTPMFVPDGGERLLVLDLTFVVPGQDGGWAMPAERRYTLFLLKTTLMKNLKHFPPLPELHRKAALERERMAIPSMDAEGTGTSTPTLHDLVLGPRAERARLLDHILDNAMAGQAQPAALEEEEAAETDDNDSDWSDEASSDDGSGVKPLHRDWMDWSDKCRMLADIPFEHGWVLYVYQSKFVHAVCEEVVGTTPNGLNSRHVDVRARVLDFSPYSVARLRSQGAESRTPTPAILYQPTELPAMSESATDKGRLVSKPNYIPATDVWMQPLSTGKDLPYVERETAALHQEGIPNQPEHLTGLCIDEQRIVFVKRNRERDVIFDVCFF